MAGKGKVDRYCRREILGEYVDRVNYPHTPRKFFVVRCECGALKDIAAWSWAGNGFYRCSGCGGKVPRSLDVWYPRLGVTFRPSIIHVTVPVESRRKEGEAMS